MELKEFTYTKADKSVSYREVIVLSNASSSDKCIDITDLEDTSVLDTLIPEILGLREKFNNDLKTILAKYSLEHKIRNFRIDRMSNIHSEDIA